jgi:hypothetical protein
MREPRTVRSERAGDESGDADADADETDGDPVPVPEPEADVERADAGERSGVAVRAGESGDIVVIVNPEGMPVPVPMPSPRSRRTPGASVHASTSSKPTSSKVMSDVVEGAPEACEASEMAETSEATEVRRSSVGTVIAEDGRGLEGEAGGDGVVSAMARRREGAR